MSITVLPRSYNPWIEQLPRFLQQMITMKMGQKMQLDAEDRRIKRSEIALKAKHEREDVKTGEKREHELKFSKDWSETAQQDVPAGSDYRFHKGKFYLPRAKKNKPASLIEQYNFSMNQFATGKAAYPGSYDEWNRKNKKSGATRISMGEKLTLKEKTSALNIRQSVKKVDFPGKVEKALESKDPEAWYGKPKYEKQELVFREMDRQIKVAHADKQVVFDENRDPPGWYVGNKLVRRWIDPNRHRRDGLR